MTKKLIKQEVSLTQRLIYEFGKNSYERNLKLSKEIDKERIPEHIAIIMDGNGRWATKRGYLDHLDIMKALEC